ncbi:MAG: hypothetical protein GXO55_00315 [Chloroflexi bacterium]|nr:hypothetical protein [Chloroflexota bacterium]
MASREKIAIVSDDARTVSPHFGRAAYYVVVTLEDGEPVAWETRARTPVHHEEHHHHGHHHGHHHEGHAHGHHRRGMGAHAAQRHAALLAPVRDCDVLIAGGMGLGAYENIQAAGKRIILTRVRSIEEVVQAYARGSLVHELERVH